MEKEPAPSYQKEVLQDLGVVPGAVVIPRFDWVSCLISCLLECVLRMLDVLVGVQSDDLGDEFHAILG